MPLQRSLAEAAFLFRSPGTWPRLSETRTTSLEKLGYVTRGLTTGAVCRAALPGLRKSTRLTSRRAEGHRDDCRHLVRRPVVRRAPSVLGRRVPSVLGRRVAVGLSHRLDRPA